MRCRSRYAACGGTFTLLAVAGLMIGLPSAGASAPGFADVLAAMQAQLTETADYRCRMETWSTDGDTSRTVVLAYAYRRPAKVRMEVLEGPYAGSLLIYDRESNPRRVRALAGNPWLAALQRFFYGEYFAVDHRWMVDLRGNGIHESHWPHVAAHYRRYLNAGTVRSLGADTVDGRKAYRYRLVAAETEPPPSIKAEEVWIDAATYFPVKLAQYDGDGRLVRWTLMTGLERNTGIGIDWFRDFHPE